MTYISSETNQRADTIRKQNLRCRKNLKTMQKAILLCTLLVTLSCFGKEKNTKSSNPLPYSFKTYFQLFGTNEFYIGNANPGTGSLFSQQISPSLFGYAIAGTIPSKRKYDFHQVELNSISLRQHSNASAINIEQTYSKTFSIAVLYSYNFNIRKQENKDKAFQIYLGINTGMGYMGSWAFSSSETRAFRTSYHMPAFIIGLEPKFIFQTKSPIYIECSVPVNIDLGVSITQIDNTSIPLHPKKSISMSIYNMMPFANFRVALGLNIPKKKKPN